MEAMFGVVSECTKYKQMEAMVGVWE